MHEHRDDFDRIPYWEPGGRLPPERIPIARVDLACFALVAFALLYLLWQIARWWL